MKNSFFFSVQNGRFRSFLLAVFSTVHKQALLGFLFVLTSFPLVTAFCSWNALCLISKKIIDGEEVRTVKDYFSLFFSSFKKTFLLSLLFLVIFAFGINAARVYFSLQTSSAFLAGGISLSFLLLAVFLFLFLPFSGKKRQGFFERFESFALSIPRCALSFVLVFLFVGVPLLLLPYSLPIVLTFSFPISSLCCAFVLDKANDKE